MYTIRVRRRLTNRQTSKKGCGKTYMVNELYMGSV